MLNLLISILLILCVVFLLLFLKTKYLYFSNLDTSQIEIENFKISVAENINLNAYLILPKYAVPKNNEKNDYQKIPLIILNHGWGMNATMMLYWAIGLSLGGPYACFLYEVRGHGKSQGKKKLSEELMNDVHKVIDYVFELKNPFIDFSNVGFFGFSYGANCALTKAYLDTRINAIVAVAGPHDTKYNFIRKPENWRARIGLFIIKITGIPAKKISDEENERISPKYILDPTNNERNKNILLIHGVKDNVIHVSECEKNRDLLQLGDRNVAIIRGAHHSVNSQEWIVLSRSLQFFHEKLK